MKHEHQHEKAKSFHITVMLGYSEPMLFVVSYQHKGNIYYLYDDKDSFCNLHTMHPYSDAFSDF